MPGAAPLFSTPCIAALFQPQIYMKFDPEAGEVDWDGLFTFLLTLLLIIPTLGVPLLLTLRDVIQTARSTVDNTDANLILVFGKRLQGGRVDADYRARLQAASELMHREPSRHLLLLGGTAGDNEISESAAGEEFLISTGLKKQRLSREEKSRNTLENLRHARDLLSEQSSPSMALLSNRYHLARIHTMALSLGMDHQLCAAEANYRFRWRLAPRLLMEAWYILWFQTGKRWARLIHSQRMLDRVT